MLKSGHMEFSARRVVQYLETAGTIRKHYHGINFIEV